jgi:hypothetical protein
MPNFDLGGIIQRRCFCPRIQRFVRLRVKNMKQKTYSKMVDGWITFYENKENELDGTKAKTECS